MDKKDLLNTLDQFHGTTQYYRLHQLSPSVLTDGAKYLADKARCYWLFEIIDIWAIFEGGNMAFINTDLKVKDDSSADVTIEDGNYNILYHQKIEFTDFPLEKIQLFAVQSGGVWYHMLPGEY